MIVRKMKPPVRSFLANIRGLVKTVETVESSDKDSSTTSGNVEESDGTFALGLVGGFLMLVLPLAPVEYNARGCVSGTGCFPTGGWVQSVLVVAMFVYIFSAVAVLITASMLRIRNVPRPSSYGWTLISLAVIHMSGLASTIALSTSQTGNFPGLAILAFLGPVLVLFSGWSLVKK